MKQDKEHIDVSAVDKQSKAFFSGGTFRWKKSQDDVWATIEARIDAQPKGRSLVMNITRSKWAVAAGIVVILSMVSFLRFYSVTVETIAGQHLAAKLPDHSKASLNAQTTLKYYPYWWKIKRIVKLDGEAFFEVEKGKKFAVISQRGTTQVLGTSFNIFSRAEIYKVTCITGSVKVKSTKGFEAILKPNGKAEIKSDGKIDVLTDIETFPEISWRKNIFLFTASPVLQVFHEIERQYGVKIVAQPDNYSLYTGNFSKEQSVEETLSYVCPALGLKYAKNSAGAYLITKDDE